MGKYDLTVVERIYCDVFDCSYDSDEVLKYMPDGELKAEDILKSALMYKIHGLRMNADRVEQFFDICDPMISMEDACKKYGLTRTRLYQIRATIIRKLKHPIRKTYLRTGLWIPDEYVRFKQEYEQQIIEEVKKKVSEDSSLVNPRNFLIDELGLSVRSYNGLKRAKIRTIGDILNLTYKDLISLRNVGHMSRGEIVMAVRKYFPDYLKED